MTTLYEMKIRCALCGNESQFTGVASTNAFGSPDLDTRPPEMQRSTMFTWVKRCPACGYCASDVGESRPGAKAAVNGTEYRAQLNNSAYPELANSFLCQGIVDRETGDYASATWALIQAAWACDDAGRAKEAAACRSRAADLLVMAENHGQPIADEAGASTAILVDLLRRSGRFEEARKAIADRPAGISESTILLVLDFESVLVERGDTSCYTISEGVKSSEDKTKTFRERVWIVRRRVLAFEGVFFGAAAAAFLTVWYASHAKGDPGPVIYVFVFAFPVVLGTFPVLTYFLNRWIVKLQVANCPSCSAFLWQTTIHASSIAISGRCPHCFVRLKDCVDKQADTGRDRIPPS